MPLKMAVAALRHFLIETLCVSIHTLPTLPRRAGQAREKRGFPAGWTSPACIRRGRPLARPPERCHFQWHFALAAVTKEAADGDSIDQTQSVSIKNTLMIPQCYVIKYRLKSIPLIPQCGCPQRLKNRSAPPPRPLLAIQPPKQKITHWRAPAISCQFSLPPCSRYGSARPNQARKSDRKTLSRLLSDFLS